MLTQRIDFAEPEDVKRPSGVGEECDVNIGADGGVCLEEKDKDASDEVLRGIFGDLNAEVEVREWNFDWTSFWQ